ISEPDANIKTKAASYGAAVAATAVAVLARAALTPLIGASAVPFMTFYPAVLFSAWFGGFRAGALSLVLSAVAADYFFLDPVHSLLIPHPGDQITVLMFVLVGFGMALLSESQRRALQRVARESVLRREAELAERAERKRFEITLASIGDAV